MDGLDFFKMTGLVFDPPEKAPKKIKAAIGEKTKELQTRSNTESQPDKRKNINDQIKFLEEIQSRIFDGDKLVKAEYDKVVKEKLDAETQKLKTTVKLIKETQGISNPEITEEGIKKYKKESGLSQEHVKAVFTELGFTIKKYELPRLSELFPNQADKKLKDTLLMLQKCKNLDPNGPDPASVHNLYDFAAYLENNMEAAETYRSKTTDDLYNIFDSASKRFSLNNDELGKTCNTLAAQAKTNVFDKEEDRDKYNFYLKYKDPIFYKYIEGLRPLSQIKSQALDEEFAENAIKKIGNDLSCSYEDAIVVYNDACGIQYTPSKPNYFFPCNKCGRISSFGSEDEAKKKNSCQNCGAPLFKKCEKCGEMVLSNKEKCPSCGYVFGSERLFDRYYDQAQDYFKNNEFNEARTYLRKAREANPSEKQKLEKLSSEIKNAEDLYQKPLNDLSRLISEKKFVEAQNKLSQINQQFPNLNTMEYKKEIREAVENANNLYAAASKLPEQEKLNALLDILDVCADYKKAVDYLRTKKPMKCKNLSVNADEVKGVINISWAPSAEHGTQYHLVRKEGKVPSNSVQDGKSLYNGADKTTFSDDDVIPAKEYIYSLFISRMGTISDPVSATSAVYSKVQNLHIAQDKKGIRLSWEPPRNSTGATVIRKPAKTGGSESILSKTAIGSYEDDSAKFGGSYIYCVRANYSGAKHSLGVNSETIVRQAVIDSFRIRVSHKRKDNKDTCTVKWDIKQPDVNLRVMVNGKIAGECCSGNKEFSDVRLFNNAINTVTVQAFSGGKWLTCENPEKVYTYSQCEIDKKKTVISEKELSTPEGIAYEISLLICVSGIIPQGVSGFYYAVRTEADSQRWVAKEDIEKNTPGIHYCPKDSYDGHKGIKCSFNVKDEEAFYVSLITCYNVDGEKFLSECSRKKITRPLKAEIFWRVSKTLGQRTLTIHVEGNRVIDAIPEMVLCGCNENQHLTSYHDSEAVELAKIPEENLDSGKTQYTKSYKFAIDKSKKSAKLKKCFLFVGKKLPNEEFITHWDSGFNGKV